MRALPAPRAVLQPVAVAEVALTVADAAERAPLRGRIEVAGPEVASVRELAKAWRRKTGNRAAIVPFPLPGKLGRALRGGALTSARPDVRGGVTFADWLREPFQIRMVLVNGAPGLIVRDSDGVLSVIALTIDAGRITAFDVIRDPDKLAGVSLLPEGRRER